MENPLIPMGAVTGSPDRQKIYDTLAFYRAQGITQYLIYPRSGCQLHYMQDDWFRVCSDYVECARELGYTSLWLYDEFNWPSGTCNSTIPAEHPEFRAECLCLIREGDAFRTVLHRDSGMTNLLNSAAVKCFIDSTHERYAEKFGEEFGKLIKGIFTDEPSYAYYGALPENTVASVSHYDGLEADFRKITGLDLAEEMERGFLNGREDWRAVCNDLLGKRFSVTFGRQVSDWCRNHNLLLTGHLMNEYDFNAAHRYNGHILRVLDTFSLPAVDDIFTWRNFDQLEHQTLNVLAHAVEANGSKGGLAELFALGPSDLSPSQIRRNFWLTAMHGCDHYVMAVAALDPRGNFEKQTWYNPFGPEQAWSIAYRELGEEAVRAAFHAQKPKAWQIGLRYPNQSGAGYDKLPLLLAQNQFQWCFLLPEEQCDFQVILNLHGDELFDEVSGSVFPSAEAAIRWLNLNHAPSIRVTELDGSAVRDMFVRVFKDGAACIIDYSGTNRTLKISRFGVVSEFTLLAEGIQLFPAWKVSLDRPNVLRPFFQNGCYCFNVREKISGVRLCRRNWAATPEILLDGREILFPNRATTLNGGFNDIYLETIPFDLEAGKHELKCIKEPVPYIYLPAVFLTGNFARVAEKCIGPYKGDGIGLDGFSGLITQQAEMEIPLDADAVSVRPVNGTAVELKICGASLGKRLWAPFVWDIPMDLRGRKVSCELIRAMSCGPMFGRIPAVGKSWPDDFRPDNAHLQPPFLELQFHLATMQG